MNRLTKSLLTMGAVLSLAATANAVTLADLETPGATISTGDKTFGDFGFSVSGSTLSASQINVSTLIQGGVYYLVFQGPFAATAGTTVDVGLKYSVTASGGNKITAIDQAFNLSGGAGGILTIGETVFSGGFFSGQIGQSTVSYDAAHPGLPTIDFEDPPGELLQGDQLDINPGQTKVWVTKDVFLNASASGGTVGATFIAQSFHQGVPDGGVTLILLGLAFSAIAGVRRFELA